MKPDSDCNQHKKEVLGITNMKLLAELIGNLHYETFQEFLFELSIKLHEDGSKDTDANRVELGSSLEHASDHLANAAHCMQRAWRISKPFMK